MVLSRESEPEITDSFVLLTPTHRLGNAQTFWCIERAHQHGVRFVWIPHPGDALIGRSRSIQATWVLEHSPTPYAIFLDSDIVFEPKDLQRLFDNLRNGYDLIGGTYVVRSGEQLASYGVLPQGGVVVDGGITEVRYLSTGFMGFTRKLLQKMVDELKLPLCHADSPPFRCYPFFENTAYLHDGKWIYLSEDWDFCEKAKKVGVKPYMDTGIMLGHEGFKTWKFDDMPKERVRALTPQNPAALGAKPKLHIPNRDELKAVRELDTSRLVSPRKR